MLNIDPLSSVRTVSGPNPAATLEPVHRTETADTLGASDGRASSSSWIPSRPALTQPSSLPGRSEYRLLASSDETRNLGSQIMETLGLRLQGVRSEIQDISKQNIQKLKEAAERASASSFWSTLKKIATCLLSAASVIFGFSFLASGGVAFIGGAMIASGILSLANFGMAEMGTWDWVAKQLAGDNDERRKKIAMILPMAVGIIGGGIGLAGSVQGIATGAIQFAEKAMTIAQSALTIFDGATTFGKGAADARLQWAQADLSKIQGLLSVENTKFDTLVKEIEGSMLDFKAIKAKSTKTIQIISKSNVQLVRI